MNPTFFLQGANLWWPETLLEAEFVAQTFPFDGHHVGIRAFSSEEGLIFADNSVGIGLHGLSTFEELTNEDNLMTNERCVVMMGESGLMIKSPCPEAVGVCRQKISERGILCIC